MVSAAVKEKEHGRTIIRHHSVSHDSADTERSICVNDPEWECDNCGDCHKYEPLDYFDERRRDAEREEQV